jgi:hypothetical protein
VSPADQRLAAILGELGYPVARPRTRRDFTVTTIRETVLAFDAWLASGRSGPARVALTTLCGLLAQHPHTPLGETPEEVLAALVESVAAVEAGVVA